MSSEETKRRYVSNVQPEAKEKEKEAPKPAAVLRFVAFAEDAGVFLGTRSIVNEGDRLIWSKLNPDGLSTAPTFVDRLEFLAYIKEKAPDIGTPNFSYKMVQVSASLDGKFASMDDISSSGLPRWNP